MLQWHSPGFYDKVAVSLKTPSLQKERMLFKWLLSLLISAFTKEGRSKENRAPYGYSQGVPALSQGVPGQPAKRRGWLLQSSIGADDLERISPFWRRTPSGRIPRLRDDLPHPLQPPLPLLPEL